MNAHCAWGRDALRAEEKDKKKEGGEDHRSLEKQKERESEEEQRRGAEFLYQNPLCNARSAEPISLSSAQTSVATGHDHDGCRLMRIMAVTVQTALATDAHHVVITCIVTTSPLPLAGSRVTHSPSVPNGGDRPDNDHGGRSADAA